jgi:signal transduction histidine kinase
MIHFGKHLCLIPILLCFSFVINAQVEADNKASDNEQLELHKKLITIESDIEKSDLIQEFAWSKIHSNPELSLESVNMAIQFAENENYKKGLANGFHTLGMIHWYRNSYEIASTNFFKALNIREEIGDTIGMGRSYNNIGNLYFKQKNYSEALTYYEKSLNIRSSIPDSVGIIYCYNSLAEVYSQQQLNKKALNFYTQALELAKYLNHTKGLAFVHSNLGQFYLNTNEPKLALENFVQALSFSEKAAHKNGIATNYNNIARALIAQNERIPQAILMANASINIADSIKSIEIKSNAYEILSEAYALTGDFKQALNYAQFHKTTEANIFNNAISKSVSENQTLYEAGLQKSELLAQKNELLIKEKQLNNRSFIAVLSVLLGLLISGFFIYTKWRYQKKTNSILAQKNKELLNSNQALERFAFDSSHDLREPLNNINSFTGLILKDAIANNNTKHINYATVIKNSCDNLDRLIRGVLNYSKLKSSNTIVNVDLNQILDQVKSDLVLVIKNKHVKIESSNLPIIKSDKTKIYQVFKNIIENGIKYNTSTAPIINISYQEKDAYWIFSFKDNGIGIKKEYHEVIFQMFKRLHNKEEYQGSGIGLASIKSFIDGLKGSITVNSELGEGSEFVIRLPKI